MKEDIERSPEDPVDDLRPEYDFRGAVREKDYRPLEKGYVIYIHQPDGSTIVKHVQLENGILYLRTCRNEKK